MAATPPAPALALALALALLTAAAATPAQPPRVQRQLSASAHPSPLTKANAPVGGLMQTRPGRQLEDDGSTFARALGAVAAPLLELLRVQFVVGGDTLQQVARAPGTGAALSLLAAAAGASSGGSGSAAPADAEASPYARQDLVL